MMTDRTRIETLRSKAVEPVIAYEEIYLHFMRKFAQTEGKMELRYAEALEYAFDHAAVCIDEGELIVGKASCALTDEQTKEWLALRDGVGMEINAHYGQDSHMAVDYELLLREGTAGIAARIKEKLQCDLNEETRLFYETCIRALNAMVHFSRRYAEKLRELSKDSSFAQEMLDLADICDRVPEYPARTFHEAVQSVHFLTFCLSVSPQRPQAHQQFQLGHPDRYLYRFYQADKAAGTLTEERAQMLIDCLAVQINNRVPHGLSSGYMVGGRDRSGKLVANELTLMGMQAVDNVRLVYPAVGFCWTKDMPEKYLAKACEVLSHGRSHPAIFNDDVITEGLMSYGVDEAQAHDYIHSTCVEITPVAASNVWVASPYTNMLKLLLDRMDAEYESFDALVDSILSDLDSKIVRDMEEQNRCRRLRRERGINPLLSCFVDDCIERGLDMDRGGAKYNWILPSFVGMANLVDSLHAIKKMVFEQKLLTMCQLKAAVDANFEGHEALRLRLLNGIDKYGNDCDEVDALFTRIVDHIVSECRKHTPELPNARLIPSVFCWVMHERFGRETGASPDGRLAGFPLGDGSGPCQGREKNGPTASILSSTKWSHKELIGGVAVNMKFSKKTFTADSTAKIRQLVRVYMQRGGFEIQINVVDRDTLLRAQENPEMYKDLVVRIGGYSDYFVKISPEMQAEVLLRTAHEG